MKNIVATALILTAGVAQAGSFQHEKAIGAEQLFSTLRAEQVTSVNTGHNANFAYQVNVGSEELDPSLS